MASLNAAERFGLRHLGAVAPGFLADLMVVDDLRAPHARLVVTDGRVVAQHGLPTFEVPVFDYAAARDSVHLGALDTGLLELHADSTDGHCRVIGLVPGQIITRHLVLEPTVRDGQIVSDVQRDLLKLAVLERHRATGNVGIGLVQGFGLRAGALASSVAHDAHNIGVVGTNDADMLCAIRAVANHQGGLAVVRDSEVLASLPLPIGGLMSDLPFEDVARRLEQVEAAAASLGCRVARPFMALSFLALSVIPSLKLTDRGLVDVDAWRFVPVQL
jgi:adenine deaminase